jgi:hypothetical protein
MDKTDLENKMESSGDMETSILSAHMRYFKGNSETYHHLKDEESVLYDTVVRYFAGKMA